MCDSSNSARSHTNSPPPPPSAQTVQTEGSMSNNERLVRRGAARLQNTTVRLSGVLRRAKTHRDQMRSAERAGSFSHEPQTSDPHSTAEPLCSGGTSRTASCKMNETPRGGASSCPRLYSLTSRTGSSPRGLTTGTRRTNHTSPAAIEILIWTRRPVRIPSQNVEYPGPRRQRSS